MKPPRVFITCGPAYEPIDEVRRITNHSTGELGALLAGALSREGFDLVCFRGEGATFPAPSVDIRPFTTNASLEKLLHAEAGQAAAVLHAAALCDFGVDRLPGPKKWKSRSCPPPLTFHRLPKLLATLRGLFPSAVIVGWKYELDGSREEAIASGRRQILTNATDACVINGSAFGPGFGFLEKNDSLTPLADKPSFSQFLAEWVSSQVTA